MAEGIPTQFFNLGSYRRIIKSGRLDEIPAPVAKAIQKSQIIKHAFSSFSRAVKKSPEDDVYRFSAKVWAQSARLAAKTLMTRERELSKRVEELEAAKDVAVFLSSSELDAAIQKFHQSRKELDDLGKTLEAEAASRLAARGGKGRADRYEQIRTEAQRLARTMAPPSGVWPSRRNAVLTIKPDVIKHPDFNRLGMSEDQAFDTIDGYLKVMPEADTLFASKHAMRTSKDTSSTS